MSTLFLTHGVGPARETLGLASAHYEDFAKCAGYDIRIVKEDVDVEGRGVQWAKVRLLQVALEEYESVLWVDSDFVLRTKGDPSSCVQPGDIMGLVMEQTPHGVGPNTGLWFVRKEARGFLDKLWSVGQLPGATLRDQATVAHLLGFSYLPGYTRPISGSPWADKVSWMDNRWNALRVYGQTGWGMHYGGMSVDVKCALMRQQIIDDRLAGWRDLIGPQEVEAIDAWTR